MDPNSTASVIDKILQNPQNWISFLILTFTIIIGFVSLLSVILGFFTSKKYLDLRQEHLNIREQIREDRKKLKQTRKEYDSIAKELRQKLHMAISEPELEKNRELLDACIDNLKKDAQLARKHIETIIPALYNISASEQIEDIKRLLTILKLARKQTFPKLNAAAADALKRMGLD